MSRGMSDREFGPVSTPGEDRPIANEAPSAADEVQRAISLALFGTSRSAAHGEGRTIDELLEIQQYERQRLGQELHDAAGQLLTSLQFSIVRLRAAMEKSDQAGLVDEISGIVGRIDQEIRTLTFLQYPAELGEKGVINAIKSLALGFGRRTGIECSFKYLGPETAVGQAVSLTLLRAAQEALTNVYRHSGASEVAVLMECRGNNLQLIIADNGIGIGAGGNGVRTGVGLTGMRRRIESHGGRLTVRRRKVGTSVSAVVPIDSDRRAETEFA